MEQRSTSEQPDVSPAIAARRLHVVDAFIDLVLETGAAPSPEELAERASISRATCFRYFSSLAELRAEAVARVVSRFPDLFDVDDAQDSDDRVRAFVRTQLRIHEKLHPLELASRAHAAENADAASFVDTVRVAAAHRARGYFAAELMARGPARRDDIVATIAVITSVESWHQFRRSHARSETQTRRAWEAAVSAALHDG